MPKITVEQGRREVQRLIDAATAAARDPDGDGVERWEAVLAHPCAAHEVWADEIWEEIHQVHRAAGRWDDAIAAKQTAIAAGYRSVPDPRADIAEVLLLAGRRGEADRLFVKLRDHDPDEVWLYNSAAWAYAQAGDHAESLRWALDGIETAIRTGDPDQVASQLLEYVEKAWTLLDQPHDQEVVELVEAFNKTWKPSPPRDWGDLPERGDQQRCAHCGYDDSRGVSGAPAGTATPQPQRRVVVAVGWLPADEWKAAVQRWPHLLDGRPEDHGEYSRGIEGHLKLLAATQGALPQLAPMTVDGIESYASERGEDPGAAPTRAAYAAELLRISQAVTWPPARNAPCWCRSGAKYKKCCGPVPAEDAQETW